MLTKTYGITRRLKAHSEILQAAGDSYPAICPERASDLSTNPFPASATGWVIPISAVFCYESFDVRVSTEAAAPFREQSRGLARLFTSCPGIRFFFPASGQPWH